MLRNYLSLENESSENNKVPQTGPEKMNVPTSQVGILRNSWDIW